MASENNVEPEDTQESDNDTENDSQETESSSPQTSTTFHSKRPCEHCEKTISIPLLKRRTKMKMN